MDARKNYVSNNNVDNSVKLYEKALLKDEEWMSYDIKERIAE